MHVRRSPDRFAESSALFALDQIIKGVIRALTGLLNVAGALLPIPGLSGLIGILNGIIRMSLTYVDEIILAYNIRTRSENPWQSSKDALILYAQNGGSMMKNAVWLSIFMWVFSLIIFLLILGPATALGLSPSRLVDRLRFRTGFPDGMEHQGGGAGTLCHRRPDAGLFQQDRGPGPRSGMGSKADGCFRDKFRELERPRPFTCRRLRTIGVGRAPVMPAENRDCRYRALDPDNWLFDRYRLSLRTCHDGSRMARLRDRAKTR